jgi:hypothetical protein
MATSLSQIISIGTVTRLYNYELSFDRVPSGIALSAPGREVHLRCTSAERPTKTNTNISVSLPGGHILPEPGIYKVAGTINLKLVETEGCEVEELINSLQQICWVDDTGVQSHMNSKSGTDMSFDFTLTQLGVDYTPLRAYKMIRCFYESVDRPGFDGSTSDASKLTLKIRYTDFRNKRA